MNLVNRIYVCSVMRRMIIAAAISCRVCAEQQSTGCGVRYSPGERINQYSLTDYARSVHWHQVRVKIISIIVFLDLGPRTFVDEKSGVGNECYLIF
jgi:hypothetical protein